MAVLNPNQVDDILEIIKKHTVLFTGSTLGPEYLSDKDKKILKKAGVDVKNLYRLSQDPLFLNYQLGMLSSVLKEKVSKNLSFKELKGMVERGSYIELNQEEKMVLQSVKTQSLADIRSVGDKIFQDFEGAVNVKNNDVRTSQEEFIRNEISDGLKNRKRIQEIARDLGKKTGDWSRNFERIVQYVSHKAFTEGRSAIIKRKSGDNSLVYVQVYEGACKHCVGHYLTNGQGSRPKIFKISELEANGTNIGRKVADWLPVIPPMHPYCRCIVMPYDGGDWDGSKFIPTEERPKVERPKVSVKIGDKEYFV